MADGFNLGSYLARIGYRGPTDPTAETLAGIVLAHAQAIPFESIDPLLARPVSIDMPSIVAKLVDCRRGGYCFEQNALLEAGLEALGFSVTGLAARVLAVDPERGNLPRTHMVLAIDLADGVSIADVGYGGQTPTGPLRLHVTGRQETPHEPYRLTNRDFGGAPLYCLESFAGGAWTRLYEFDLQPQTHADYEMANYFTSTHPNGGFLGVLKAALPAPGCRHALVGNRLSVYFADGRVERNHLTSPDALRQVLTGTFGIALPDHPGLDVKLAELAATPAPDMTGEGR